MTAPLTVIIPTLNAAHHLAGTTHALLPGLTSGLIAELILSDGGSDDPIAEIAETLGATLVTGPKGRGGQIERGVKAAKTPWLLILHADTHLSENWAAATQHHIAQHPDEAGWFHLAFRAKGFWPKAVATGANLRSRLFDLPYGDQGLLIHQTTLDNARGVPNLPLMEDVALARALKGHLRPLDATANTSPERYLKDGWVRRSTQNMGLLARFLMGADPNHLSTKYNASPRK